MAQFPSTRRSVLEAAQSELAELRREASSTIAEAYWKPAYKYIRLKWKIDAEAAQDFTQGFFTSLLERDLVAKYDATKSAFRTYLRTCIDGYVQNERKAASRQKRGGDAQTSSFDFQQAEREVAAASPAEPIEEIFYREWQRQMFSLAIDDLRRQCAASSAEIRFAVFERYDLAEEARPSYDSLAREFGLPSTTITNHLAWARRELRRCLLDRLSHITAGESEMHREAENLLGGSA